MEVTILIPQTVVETAEFIKQAKTCMSEETKDLFINFIANNPHAGDLIPGTGGARKIRWQSNNKGKSGGVRVIYYYYNEEMPIYLFTAYQKNKRENITQDEKNVLYKVIKLLVKEHLED